MILIVHEQEKVKAVKHFINKDILVLDQYSNALMSTALFSVAAAFPDENIVWCSSQIENDIRHTEIEALKIHDLEMLSFNPSMKEVFHPVLHFSNFFSTTIHDIPKKIKYQTWVMSDIIGIASAKLINKFQFLSGKFSFVFTLNAISKLGSSQGLLHYSEPALYKGKSIEIKQESFIDTLYFIRLFQNKKWLVYAYLVYVYQYKSKFNSLFKVLLKKSYSFKIDDLSGFFKSMEASILDDSDKIDVLIPTLGRKQYLHDVLKDLSKQSLLPTRVLIIEQNIDVESTSELDYLNNEPWPFKIEHTFIHQLGACNARNIGLAQAESKWLFMADDDIRLEVDTLKENVELMKSLKVGSLSIATYLPHQKDDKRSPVPYLYEGFASGASIVDREFYSALFYDTSYEFGYGEDTAYGCELRKLGCTTLYSPKQAILHLKAPVGGFRFTFEHPWLHDAIQPKPSPTMMYFHENNFSKEQLLSYKVYLFFNMTLQRRKINILKYKKEFQLQWERSQYYASLYREKTR